MRAFRFALVALALIAIAFLLWPKDEPGDAAPQTGRSKPAPRVVAPIDRPAPKTEPEKLIYTLTLEQEVRLGDETKAEAMLSAQLVWLPVPGTTVVQAQLVNATIDGIGQELPSRRDMESALLLEKDEEGRLAGLRFSSRTESPARLLLTSLHSAMQFTPGSADEYSVTEEDDTGYYRATYVRTGTRTFSREKKGYSKLHEPRAKKMRVEGTADFTLTADGYVEALQSNEKSRTQTAVFGTVVGSRRLELALVSRAKASEKEIAQARWRTERYSDAAFLVVFDEADDAALDRKLDEARVAGATLEGLWQAFAATEGQPRGGEVGKKRADLISTAGALFRLEPEEARAAGRRLGAAGISDGEANFLAGGLAAAGTLEAAHALADAITSPDATAEAQRQAAMSLTLMGQADATTVDALQEAAQSDDPTVRNTSTLALGKQARVLGENGGKEGLDPIAELLFEYERTSDLRSRLMYLAAFGNSGDPRTLPHLRAALAEPPLAEVAAFALRFIRTPEADVLLQQAALEGEPAVRAAAFRAAFYRDPRIWLPILQSAATRETYEPALQAIRGALAQFEEA